MPKHDYGLSRRTTLKRVGAIGAGLTLGSASVVGSVVGAHPDESNPAVTFPDQDALVLPNNPAPMEAAVQTKNVHMPEGGWVVISRDNGATDVVGRSINRLPAGHFKDLKVATKPLDSADNPHILYATLFKGDKGDESPGDGPALYAFTQDSAEVSF